MRFSSFTIISALAALASAHTQPDTSKPPTGNPIALPGLAEQVQAGKPYTITWDPTSKGKVSIVLLRGPSTNVKPIATLAEVIPNSGKFEWTPSTSLEPDVTHYGLEIIVEGTGQYQYSTQFGIKKAEQNEGETEPSYPTEAPEPTYPTYPTDAPEPTSAEPEPTSEEPTYPSYPTDAPEPTSAEPTYPSYPTDAPEPTDAEPTYAAPTYSWVTVSIPSSYPPSSTISATPIPPATSSPAPTYSAGPAPPQFTGAAGRNSAASLSGVAIAGLVALFAF
jgi:hypothetical protein